MAAPNKRRLHHAWTIVRRIKPWYFLILALAFAVSGVFALRDNNLKMVELRQAVYRADKDNGDVEGALRRLREHVYGHMNTGLAVGPNAVRPPIQLKYTYERLVAAKQAGAQATQASNGTIYNQAQKYCEQAIPSGFSGSYRLSCIESFVKQHALGSDPASTTTVPKNLYQFDFMAPKWSPDLAGWSLVATGLSVVGFFVSLGVRRVMRRLVA